MRTISTFWIGYCLGLLALSPRFAERDEPAVLHPGEDLPMEQWMRLKEHERAALVASYSKRRAPPPRYLDTNERRQHRPA